LLVLRAMSGSTPPSLTWAMDRSGLAAQRVCSHRSVCVFGSPYWSQPTVNEHVCGFRTAPAARQGRYNACRDTKGNFHLIIYQAEQKCACRNG